MGFMTRDRGCADLLILILLAPFVILGMGTCSQTCKSNHHERDDSSDRVNTEARGKGFALGYEFGKADKRDGVKHRGDEWANRIGRMHGAKTSDPDTFADGFVRGYTAGCR
jgi:hypothetical protein